MTTEMLLLTKEIMETYEDRLTIGEQDGKAIQMTATIHQISDQDVIEAVYGIAA